MPSIGTGSLRKALTSGGGGTANANPNPYGITGPKVQNGLDTASSAYGPQLRAIQDVVSGAGNYSPQSNIGNIQSQLARMSPAEQAVGASRVWNSGDNPNALFNDVNHIPQPSGADLARSWLSVRPTPPALSPPTPEDVAATAFNRNYVPGGSSVVQSQGMQTGKAQQIGAPLQHQAPLSAAQGGGLRASMTATGQGPMIGAAGQAGTPGGQSAQIGSLYAPPDGQDPQAAQGQQQAQMMGRLMASLFAPK